MKALSKYLALLEKEIDSKRAQLEQARKDLEFYRGKCERLEMAIMSNPAAQEQFAESQTVAARPPIEKAKVQLTPPRLPFSDLKAKWNAMTQEEQDQALKDGWDLDHQGEKEKETTDAGQRDV